MAIRVRVPASTSNLGPGFDCLGLALDLALQVRVEPGPGALAVEVEGEDASAVSCGPDNLVYTSLCAVLGWPAGDPLPIRLQIRNEIPIGRGLGSSGAAIVAGCIAGTLLAGSAVQPASLLARAAALEGHPDNVAPALLGGFVATARTANALHTSPLALPADLEFVLVVPDRATSTQAARAILPRLVPLEDAIANLAHTALLVGALARSEWALLRPALADRLHQDKRLGLVPGLGEALAALDAEPGVEGAALSGSGPTLLGFVRAGSPATGRGAARVLARHGLQARLRRVRPASAGASWEQDGLGWTLPPGAQSS